MSIELPESVIISGSRGLKAPKVCYRLSNLCGQLSSSSSRVLSSIPRLSFHA